MAGSYSSVRPPAPDRCHEDGLRAMIRTCATRHGRRPHSCSRTSRARRISSRHIRDAYASILADHHRILREAFSAHGGREVDNQGDSFFVAFRGKGRRARGRRWSAGARVTRLAGGASVRVRMGIHTGEADVTVDRYVGLSVHRAARISALGHGGQVLVSPTTAGLLDDEATLPGISSAVSGSTA